ncbi:MATE family efflux transporter [uncultured Helcococcus sp.]|uniref:MATE family efflux transporter n=1 Tax=uncultured Helcococcus sp. TaxID=1072508 RepID=UPI0026182459|nr:MATE family efflux transporter [uncultured Helcococcus sp.]
MTKTNLFKTYLKYLLPTLATMVLFSTYTMIDGIFVGQGVGSHALSAVNVAMPYVALLFAVSMLISIGSSNIITYYLGRQDKEKADEAFTIGLFLSLSISIILTLVSYFNLDLLVDILGATDSIKDLVKDYLSVIIFFSTFFIMTYIFEIMVKADGSPQLTIVFMVVSALTNIVLDYVFIFIYDYGVKGAAIATGIAQTLPCIGYMIYFRSKRAKLRLTKFKLRLGNLKEIFIYGIPASLTELSTGFIILMFNNALGDSYGEIGLTTFSVLAYVLSLVVNTMLAINQSAQPLTSYFYGAKEYGVVNRLKRYMLVTVATAGVLIFTLIQIFPGQVFGLFFKSDDVEFIKFSIHALRIFSLGFLVLGFNIGIGGYLTAIKRPKYEFIISALRGYISISVSIILIPIIFSYHSIWYALFASELLTLLVSLFLLNKVRRLS